MVASMPDRQHACVGVQGEASTYRAATADGDQAGRTAEVVRRMRPGTQAIHGGDACIIRIGGAAWPQDGGLRRCHAAIFAAIVRHG